MTPRPPDLLSEAQSEEVQRQAPWDKPDALRPWDARLAAHMKRATKIAGLAAGLIGALATLGGWIAKGWHYLRSGGAASAPAEQPPGNGVPSTALDFVTKPAPAAPQSKPGEGS